MLGLCIDEDVKKFSLKKKKRKGRKKVKGIANDIFSNVE
jgi:hypothetical protein